MQRIVIQYENGFSRIALLEDSRLAEFYMERPAEVERAGNIYKGRVVNVLPGMQAAFIDIGLDKNAFLYIDDLLPAHLGKQPADKPAISELIHEGQEIIVQVKKEPLGQKGARVTTHFAIPGRWLVLMPNADYVAVSRKIMSAEERDRLSAIGEQICRPGDGVIIRTVAEGETANALRNELEQLNHLWDLAREYAEKARVPSRIYRDLGLIPRLVRDLFTEHVNEMIISETALKIDIVQMLKETSPELVERVKLHAEPVPPFQTYGIEEELAKAFRRKIWLDSGAYLILDQTEALTVFDVNTGKFTGSVDLPQTSKPSLEQTVFETNLEAAAEIARLLRLRDIGGIILIDFIDMQEESHRQQVSDLLELCVKKDRTKTLIVGWTRLGLLEMTRKKVRQNLEGLFFETCPACNGLGKVHSKHHPGNAL